MRLGLKIPPQLVILFVALLLAIYANRKFEYHAAYVSGAVAGVTFTNSVSSEPEKKENPNNIATVLAIPSVSPVLAIPPPTYSAAGWPLKYLLEVQFSQGEPRVFTSYVNLILNVLMFIGATALYLTYEKFLGQTSESVSADGKKLVRRRVGLLDLMLVTGLVATAFGCWSLLGMRLKEDEALARRVQRSVGTFTRTALVPSPFSSFSSRQLSSSDCKNFYRLTSVAIPTPSTDLLSKLVKVETLQELHISAGSYDLRVLDELPNRAMLHRLSIVGRELDAQAVAAIAACKSLNYLNLMRTNITAEGIRALGEMPQLRELNLIHTDVKLSEFKDIALCKNIEHIALPHGVVGTSDELLVDDWPQLKTIECVECDTLRNKSPVLLHVRNCSQLETIALDVLQNFELKLDNLPNLQTVSSRSHQIRTRVKESEAQPTSPMLSRIELNSVPNLKSLPFMPAQLESILISDASQLELAFQAEIWSTTIEQRMRAGIVGLGAEMQQEIAFPIPREQRQKWVDDLGVCNGPSSVSFAQIPVHDLDLKPLAQNKSLKQLDLAQSDFADFSQLTGAAFEVVRMPYLAITSQEIEKLARSLPNIRSLMFDRRTLSELQLADLSTLEHILAPSDSNGSSRFYDRLNLQRVRLKDMPVLAEDFDFSGYLQKLHLENVPALTGLSFVRPIPKGSTVKGLRNLKYFAAGGPTMDDTIMSEVLNCADLQKLTLAYSAVTPAMLKRIGELRSLQYLVLTGSQVTDETIAAMPNLAGVNTLALDKTQITSASIPQIVALQNLKSLALDGSLLDEQAFAEIAKMVQLKQLCIRGATLTRGAALELAKLISLQELDLSGSHLTLEAALPLLESRDLMQTLACLKLNSGKIDEQALKGFMIRFPNLTFELVGCDIPLELMDVLAQNQRALLTEPNNQEAMAMRFNAMSSWIYSQSAETPSLDEVEAKYFDTSRPQIGPPSDPFTDPDFGVGPTQVVNPYSSRPMNPLERIGAWIADSAFAIQPLTKPAPATIE